MKIKKGELFVITHGEYSDYGLITLGRAKKDLDIEQLINKFTKNRKTRTYLSGSYKFVNWLVNIESCVEELMLNELNLAYMFNQISLKKKDKVKKFIKENL